MKREIKFRAFVRGYIAEVVSINFIDKYITWDDGQYDRCHPPNKCFEIESFEEIKLMQFTGDKDLTGKESYEGDIIENENGDKRKIMWVMTGFEMRLLDGSRDKFNNTIWWFKYTIIGNIYENPELLTNKQ